MADYDKGPSTYYGSHRGGDGESQPFSDFFELTTKFTTPLTYRPVHCLGFNYNSTTVIVQPSVTTPRLP